MINGLIQYLDLYIANSLVSTACQKTLPNFITEFAIFKVKTSVFHLKSLRRKKERFIEDCTKLYLLIMI